MSQEVQAIPLSVKCFLVKTGDGFLLIDTGVASDRARLDQALAQAGVQPGNLKLVLLTHSDADHIGNVAFLKQKYGAKTAAHPAEVEAVNHADAHLARKAKPDRISFLGRLVMALGNMLPHPSEAVQTTTDLLLEDGFDLSPYGFDARVVHLPGHTRGSIGFLTADGDLYCGDMLMNMMRPTLPIIIDDLSEIQASLEKLKKLNVRMIIPSHGKPFAPSALK